MVGSDFDSTITCRDQVGSCARRTCECDRHFAIHAAELFVNNWEGNYHGLDFDRSTECAPREGHGSHFENDCQREVRLFFVQI